VEHLQEPSTVKLRNTLLVLFGAVGLVLLIACANIVNLAFSFETRPGKRSCLRTALGASPWRLIRQLLTESTLLALAGGALGLLLAIAGLKALLAFVPADLAVLAGQRVESHGSGFTVAVCLAAGSHAVCCRRFGR